MTADATGGGEARRWWCCQLRAREHFMVPVGLARRHALSRLVTDLWVPPRSAIRALVPRLRDIYHPALDGCVSAFNRSALMFELGQIAAGTPGWTRLLRRNEWFQTQAVREIQRRPGDATVLFSYSYTARRVFEYAKSRGWTTVLGQIDPGLAEERLVASLQSAHPGVEVNWRPAPPEYWQRWRDEIALADRIVVHSPWSRDALIGIGVDAAKLVVVPLAYEPPSEAATFARDHPRSFSTDRPLRVLFLGQVILRKGALALLDAARELRGEPIEFILAGPNALHESYRATDAGRIRWMGSVPRGRTAAVYQQADVFLFPTVSDGFGLAQLEAQAWGLPVISTANCGQVVRDGINGVQLSAGSGAEIANVLRRMVADPAMVAAMSRASRVDEQHRPDRFAMALQNSVQ